MENSYEEGLLTSIGNPSHTAWTRPAFAVAALAWFLGFVLYASVDIPMGPIPFSFIVIAVGLIPAALLVRWGNRFSARHSARVHEEARVIREAEQRRQLEEARNSGALDRWK